MNEHSVFREILLIVVGVLVLVFSSGLILLWQPEFKSAITLKTESYSDIAIGLFGVYVAISLAIESTVEIYIKVFRKSDFTSKEDHDKNNSDSEKERDTSNLAKEPEIKIIATIAGLIVGIAVSLAGVRFLEPFFETNSLSGFQALLFHALDILLTAGLLSGGSDGIHQITSFYRQRVERSKSNQ